MNYSFLVLLGCKTSTGQAETFGTGFIVDYNKQLYVVSCKHVYHEVKNKDCIFAIPNPKQTLSPKNGYSIIPLSSHCFHIDDNSTLTYDIIVFKLVDIDKNALLSNGIKPIELSSNYKSLNDNSIKLYSIGFPVDYTEKYLANNTEANLPPKKIEVYLQDVQINSQTQVGFTEKLAEPQFLRIPDGNFLGKGASGGLVYSTDESNTTYPVGLIVGEAEVESGKYLVFARIERVIETISKVC
ncbi:MAG: hypothetical protein IT279_01735 [Ignavibacteriaceae bacterium]|nr:hypothetical protein [Ignavibacteriaceae bacterium]